MKKTYLAVAVAGAAFAFVATPAIAQDYQMEAGLSYLSLSPDEGESDSAIGVDFTYYLETVSTAGKPLAEAAWLNRNNNVGLAYTTVDKADLNILNLNGEFWFEDIYVAANIDRWDAGDDDDIDFAVSAGYMIDNGLLAYATIRQEAKYDGVDDKTGFGVGAKYVADLGGNFVNLEADIDSIDSNLEFNVAGDYYLSNELSVGLSLSAISLDDKYKNPIVDNDKLEFGINAKYFFLPNVSGEVNYTLNNDHADKDSAIGLRVAARF